MESKKTVNERELSFYMARVQEKCCNYDKVLFYMKKIMKMKVEMSWEEKELIALAAKEKVGVKRSALRTIVVLLDDRYEEADEEDSTDRQIIEELENQRLELEKEIYDICSSFVCDIDTYLLPNSTSNEDKAYFWKMKADYLRYQAEPDSRGIDEEECERAFEAKEAYECAERYVETLSKCNTIRLGFFLNYTVFLHNVLGDTERAITIAKKVFEDAISELDEEENGYVDACTVMEMIRENMKVWENEY